MGGAIRLLLQAMEGYDNLLILIAPLLYDTTLFAGAIADA